jgi:hypothetical protein
MIFRVLDVVGYYGYITYFDVRDIKFPIFSLEFGIWKRDLDGRWLFCVAFFICGKKLGFYGNFDRGFLRFMIVVRIYYDNR